MLSLMFAEFVSAFETSMVFAALPTISRESGDPVLVGWLVTGYLLVQAVSAALLGRLGDLFGRRDVLLLTLVLCAVGSLISAIASDLTTVVMGRAIQGMSGGILPLACGLAREHIAPKQVPFCLGLLAMMVAFGAMIGLLSGGIITDHLHWLVLFQITAVLAVVAAVCVFLSMPAGQKYNDGKPLDILGGLLFGVAVAIILFGIGRGGHWGWGNWPTLAAIGSGSTLLLLWGGYEYRHPNPLINVRLLAERQIALASISMAAMALAGLQVSLLFVMVLQQPTWTGIGLGLSATAAGLLKLPSNFSAVLGGPISGAIASRRGTARGGAVFGSAVILLGFVWLSSFNQDVVSVVIASVTITFGVGVAYASVPILVSQVAPQERVSELIGMTAVIRSVFMAIGAQIIVVLLATSTVRQGNLILPSAQAFRAVFVYSIIASLVCLIFMWFLPRATARGKAESKSNLPGSAPSA